MKNAIMFFTCMMFSVAAVITSSALMNPPECISSGQTEGWYVGENLIRSESCMPLPFCGNKGTADEGWYSPVSGKLLKKEKCDRKEDGILSKKEMKEKLIDYPLDVTLKNNLKETADRTIISFRIDDMTFSSNQKTVLENALSLARKYNVTFDLAVIAQNFDRGASYETFDVYLKNRDVFEIVAHGLTHTNPVNYSSKGEFYDNIQKKKIPADIQEEHIKAMKSIFDKHRLVLATRISILPWNAGDEDTIRLSEKNGYNVIVQTTIPGNAFEYRQGDIIATRQFFGVNMSNILSDIDIKNLRKWTGDAINRGQKRIQVVTHPINYNPGVHDFETALSAIISEARKTEPSVVFTFISNAYMKKASSASRMINETAVAIIPSCKFLNGTAGWYAEKKLLRAEKCVPVPVCNMTGTTSEGWYSPVSGLVISYDACGGDKTPPPSYITPEEAGRKAVDAGLLLRVREVLKNEKDGRPFYVVNGRKRSYFLWIIPVEVNGTAMIDAATGAVMK